MLAGLADSFGGLSRAPPGAPTGRSGAVIQGVHRGAQDQQQVRSPPRRRRSRSRSPPSSRRRTHSRSRSRDRTKDRKSSGSKSSGSKSSGSKSSGSKSGKSSGGAKGNRSKTAKASPGGASPGSGRSRVVPFSLVTQQRGLFEVAARYPSLHLSRDFSGLSVTWPETYGEEKPFDTTQQTPMTFHPHPKLVSLPNIKKQVMTRKFSVRVALFSGSTDVSSSHLLTRLRFVLLKRPKTGARNIRLQVLASTASNSHGADACSQG